ARSATARAAGSRSSNSRPCSWNARCLRTASERRLFDGGRCPTRVGEAEVRPRPDDLVDAVEQLLVEADVGRSELALELLQIGRANDRRRHRRVIEDERDRE